MSLFKRGDKWWVDVSVPGKERVRCSTGTTDRKQAQEYHDKLKVDLWRQVKMGEKPRRTWEEAAVRWLRESQHKRSLSDDIDRIDFFDKKLKGKYLDQITANLISEIVETGKAGLSAATRNRYYALIRAILRRAEKEWEWIERAPHIRLHKEARGRVRYISHVEFATLLRELPEYLRSVVMFAVATGLRMRNITHLEWREVDLGRRVAIVDTKNGNLLRVPLNDLAMKVLTQETGRHETRVFTCNGNPFDNANTSVFQNALKRAGIKDFRFHDLRHTWASWMVQSGTVTEHQLQKLGGWLDPKMVRRYGHLSPDQLDRAAGAIDVVLAGGKDQAQGGMAQIGHIAEPAGVTQVP